MLLAENISIITRYYANAQFPKKEDIQFLVQVSKVKEKQNKHRAPHLLEWTNYQALFHLGMEDNRMNGLFEEK